MNNELNLELFDQDEILEIQEMGILPTVDIEVEDTHMFYLANRVYTHNSGLNAEIITMESISEAFNKCFVADFICTISRTIQDKQKNTGRMFVAKNRNGVDGLVYPMIIDTSNVSLKVLPQIEEDGINTVLTPTPQEQLKKLKEKYNQHVKNKEG